jgi:hypothetical protein
MRVADQVPARRVAGVRKQRVDAGLRLGIGEHEIGFLLALVERVVALHGDRSEGFAVGDAIAERKIIGRIKKGGSD